MQNNVVAQNPVLIGIFRVNVESWSALVIGVIIFDKYWYWHTSSILQKYIHLKTPYSLKIKSYILDRFLCRLDGHLIHLNESEDSTGIVVYWIWSSL